MTDVTALVVVNYGSTDLLAHHLVRTTEGQDGLVVVVDNWSGVSERRAVTTLAADRGWHLVPLGTNGGFGAGVNAGVDRAAELGADVVVLLNPDLEVDAAAVQALAGTARADRDCAVAPLIRRPDGRVWFSGGSIDLLTGRTRATGTTPPQWLSGACLAVSLDLWRRVGGFDPEYFLYWEDVDLSHRIRAAGGHLRVLADVTATHDAGGTQATAGTRAKSPTYYRYTCRGRLVFAGTHLSARSALRWALWAPVAAREIVLRGGRRQLLRSAAPVLAAARGTLEGLMIAVRRLRSRKRGARSSPSGAAGARERRLLVAHPSPDLYGSDRQMLETVSAAVQAGWAVEVVVPGQGPLIALLEDAGARVRVVAFPVLRKALLHPTRLVGLGVGSARSALRHATELRRDPPDLVLVNTVTIPWWIAAARLARVPVLCHVHEAEESQPRVLAALLAAPLLLSNGVVANSGAARRALTRALPPVGRAVVVVHNGVPGPIEEPEPATHREGTPWRLALVGRLSPRKGTDVALEAVALLVGAGLDVHLTVCGTVFDGYEWYEDQLRDRARSPDLAGRVDLAGYVHPTWPVLARSEIVLVPSRTEPFGNTAVEGMAARRPVVASDVQGLAEVVDSGRTGLLVRPDDPAALAAAITRLIESAELRSALADAGRREASTRFSTDRYASAILARIDATAFPEQGS